MLRTIALLAAVLSTVCFAQDTSAQALTPPPPPPTLPELPSAEPTRAPSRPLRPLSAEEPNRFHYTRGAVPPGFHLVEEPKWGLVAAGSAAFAVSTLVMVMVAAASFNGLYAVPVVGQFAAFYSLTSSGGLGLFFGSIGLLIDLAAQVAGAVMLIVGVTNPKRWIERDVQAPRVMLVPGAAGAPAGASLVGRF